MRMTQTDFCDFTLDYQELARYGYTRCDAAIARGEKVFADFKFHDIPSTVARNVAALTKRKVTAISVHAAGGKEMMIAAKTAAKNTAAAVDTPEPHVIAVIDPADEKTAERLTAQVNAAGLSGVLL